MPGTKISKDSPGFKEKGLGLGVPPLSLFRVVGVLTVPFSATKWIVTDAIVVSTF